MSYLHDPAGSYQGPPPGYPTPPGYGAPPGYPTPPAYSAPPGYSPPSGHPAAFRCPLPSGYPAAPRYPAALYPSGFGPFWISLVKHTGMLVLWQNRSYRVAGTLAECERAYRDAQTHNLTAGWWSLTSVLVMNWISLAQNARAISRLRRIAQQATEPTPARIP